MLINQPTNSPTGQPTHIYLELRDLGDDDLYIVYQEIDQKTVLIQVETQEYVANVLL